MMGALTAGPRCSQIHSTRTCGSAEHTSHRGEWAAFGGSSRKHWLLGQELWGLNGTKTVEVCNTEEFASLTESKQSRFTAITTSHNNILILNPSG